MNAVAVVADRNASSLATAKPTAFGAINAVLSTDIAPRGHPTSLVASLRIVCPTASVSRLGALMLTCRGLCLL